MPKHKIRYRLELQPALARRLGQCFYSAMVLVSTPVEYNLGDTCLHARSAKVLPG